MICVSIGNVSFKKCLDAVRKYELCELRLDQLKLGPEELKKVLYVGKELIACYRTNKLTKQARELLELAVNNGASYIDVDLNWSDSDRKKLLSLAKKKGAKVIMSYHNYKCTPSSQVLSGVLSKCSKLYPDVIKISCMSRSNKDNARLLGLLDQPNDLIVIGMGAKGRVTRLVAPMFGSFCTYASLDEKSKTAPGQLSVKEMENTCCSL